MFPYLAGHPSIIFMREREEVEVSNDETSAMSVRVYIHFFLANAMAQPTSQSTRLTHHKFFQKTNAKPKKKKKERDIM